MNSGRGVVSLNGGGSRHGGAAMVEIVLVRSVIRDGSVMTETSPVPQATDALRK